jgi:hypothetical protein
VGRDEHRPPYGETLLAALQTDHARVHHAEALASGG